MSDSCELRAIDLPRAEELRAARLNDAEHTASAFRGLADPARVHLAFALRDGGELCVCDLAWIVERPQALVSHHLRLMRASGVAASRRDGKMVMYSLTPVGEQLVDSVRELVSA